MPVGYERLALFVRDSNRRANVNFAGGMSDQPAAVLASIARRRNAVLVLRQLEAKMPP